MIAGYVGHISGMRVSLDGMPWGNSRRRVMLRIAIVCWMILIVTGCAALPERVAATRYCSTRALDPCTSQLGVGSCLLCPE